LGNRARPVEFDVINLSQLAGFDSGSTVDIQKLVDAGFVHSVDSKVKLLASGEIKSALTIKVNAASKTAIDKVEKVGGKVELV
jgi:large subunit ribosomal protein L15